MQFFIKIISAIFIIGFLSTCTTYEQILSPTDYKIKIVDADGRPLPAVKVSFFNTEADMRANESAIATLNNLSTNEYGLVDLKTSELVSTGNLNNTFYMSAEYGLKNNWDSLPYIKIENRMFNAANNYTVTIPIKESIKNFIVGRKSKRWKQTDYRINGNSSTSCDYRLTWEFFRNSPVASIYNGTNCGVEGALRGSYFWTTNEKPATITINGGAVGATIIPAGRFTVLNDKVMVFSFTELGFFVEYTFNAE
jgi:hypothetical protein